MVAYYLATCLTQPDLNRLGFLLLKTSIHFNNHQQQNTMEILKATEVQKQDGWKAETTVKKFGMDWEIYTRKGRGGTLVSHAQSGTYTPAGVEGHFSSFQYVTFQSPAVQLATVKGRATEKAVTAAHAQALEEFKKLESYK